MAYSSDKVILSLSDNKPDLFKSTKSVSWSQDNRAVLCCAEKLAILSLVTSSDNNSREEFKTILDETPNVSSFPSFSYASGLLNLSASSAYINEDERQRLATDSSLCEELVFPSAMLNTFKHAVCSPQSPAQCVQILIAAVTYDYRIFIFVESVNGWEMLMECSPLLKDKGISELKCPLPLTLQKHISFENYANLVYGMCCSEVEWSSVFTTGVDQTASYLLLFTGMRNGDIHVWEAKLPLEGRDGLSLKCTDKYHSEVTALAWTPEGQDRGLLAIGYMNGSVRVLQVNVTFNPEFSVDCEVLYTDLLEDDLSIADLAWARLDKVSSVLLACKQYFLSVYMICDNKAKFIRHFHNDVEMPLTSISAFGARGVVSSYDGSVFCFECQQKEGQGDLSLNLSEVNITNLPHGTDVQWLCLGVAISPTAGLCISTYRIHQNFKVATQRRRFMNRQMVVVNTPFKLTAASVTDALNNAGDHLSPQNLMLSIRLHVQQLCKTGSSLEEIRQIYSSLLSRADIKSLQIARDILKYFKQNAAATNSFHKELEWVNPSFEMVSEKLIDTHVISCLDQMLSERNKNEQLVMKSMLKWIFAKQQRSADIGKKLNLEALGNICQNAEYQICSICSSEFEVNGFLTVKCSKGHKIKQCSLTLLPCQNRSDRKCEACGHPSIGLTSLSDVRLIKFKTMCLICGAFLRQNIA